MKKIFVFLGLVALFFAAKSWAVESELALFSEEEMVVTASRREQKISEAPSAITVITADDIRYSGATNIPDVLRMVPGLDVMFVTASDANVGARGFNGRLSNRMLILIDGRPSYLKLLGNFFWEALSFPLEEIKRIEIIKGPGSALYGANAYCGVIHIITKSAQDLKGTAVSFTGGEKNTYLGSLINAGIMDKLDYKVSLSWYQTDQWTEEKESIDGLPRGNVSVGYKLAEDSAIKFTSGHGETKGEMAAGEIPMEKDGGLNYTQIDYSKSNLKLIAYWESIFGDTLNKTTQKIDNQKNDTYEVDVQHMFDLVKNNAIIWGLDARKSIVESDLIRDGEKSQDSWAVYLQDEFKPVENFSMVVGGRYDYHPLYGEHTTPRVSAVYSPIKNHSFRISAATAFRAPSFFESYIDSVTVVPISPAIFPALSVPINLLVPFMGNEDLNPEKVTSYEIGYNTFVIDKIRGRIDLFYNEYKDIVFATSVPYGTEEIFPGVPGDFLPKIFTYSNMGKSDSRGGEISLDFFMAKWLTGLVNYSYEKIVDREDDPATPWKEENKRKKESPLNKANAGLRAKFENGVSFNVVANYVDKIEWWDSKIQDAYTLVNVRLGYQINDNLGIAVAAFNVFNDVHYEYTPGTLTTLVFGEEIGRKVTGHISYKF